MLTNTPSRPVHLRYRRSRRGVTLVELTTTVAILGILGAVATESFNTQVKTARSVEATEMLNRMAKAVASSGAQNAAFSDHLDYTTHSFGSAKSFGNDKVKTDNGNSDKVNKDAALDNDGDNGHGNSGGCDPSNPGNSGSCDAEEEAAEEEKSNNGNSDKVNKDADLDNDGNNGHGNNEGKCDPSNPGNSKNCDAEDESSDGGNDDDDSSDDSGGDDGGSGSGGGNIEKLCGSADPVPSSLETVAGKIYNAPSDAWATGSDSAGWKCLKISRAGNQRYQFGYDLGAATTAAGQESYTAWARGDLDGDGVSSYFRLRGELVNGTIVQGSAIEVTDAHE